MFFTKASVNWSYIALFYSKLKNGAWSAPQAVKFTGQYRDCDPFVSADGQYLYFSSDRPVPGKPFKDYAYKLYRVKLKGAEVVSEPILVNLPIPDSAIANHCTFTANGNIYFSMSADGDSEIYRCVYKNGNFLPPEKLGFNAKEFIDFDPMVASDENFVVFSSNNRKGIGSTDLWISRNTDGQWSAPINLGPQVNTPGADGSAGLSRDNKTLYFSSARETIAPAEREKPAGTQKILQQLHSNKNGLRNIYQIALEGLINPPPH
ncbi:hypothetical protein FO440_09885 [Mucilaginibacter corticis]|uniref:Uncharacterized protein n=1 Tax=Mucilaginibacter corticis TaxID=2597670 RepID=A0A556MX55_9SPHI|nr:PD40 domain-containing protein [Mucilaginibacter corticis]TSJ44465.1 hypothetical protein FO440_09885 [Mucilaginibacter corticis]